jgi:drug/metabolite transporter (DMT)-like permease
LRIWREHYVLPIGLGLGAAACIGIGNIAAGIASRRLSPLTVGFWTQSLGVVICAILLLASRPALLPGQIPWGLLAGLVGGFGTTLFYRAMAAGAISLVAPITACSIVIPVAYAIASGESPTPLATAGILAIIGGVVLASLQPAPVEGDPTDTGVAGDRRAAMLAVAAAVAFGVFFIVIDLAPLAPGWGTIWTAGAVRVSSFGVQVAFIALGPRRITGPGRYAPAVVASGILDLTSLILINIGATTDAYALVTALVGIYPVFTALVGVALLGERLTRIQASGATLAMAGVLLVSV